jgi:hypothetical protein
MMASVQDLKVLENSNRFLEGKLRQVSSPYMVAKTKQRDDDRESPVTDCDNQSSP